MVDLPFPIIFQSRGPQSSCEIISWSPDALRTWIFVNNANSHYDYDNLTIIN
jgi:hypothetical protein